MEVELNKASDAIPMDAFIANHPTFESFIRSGSDRFDIDKDGFAILPKPPCPTCNCLDTAGIVSHLHVSYREILSILNKQNVLLEKILKEVAFSDEEDDEDYEDGSSIDDDIIIKKMKVDKPNLYRSHNFVKPIVTKLPYH